ncbi:hypothetical protein, partial [Vibrio owensii]|uniref:hypothetical protein n=1 Tax=Vibrio owensii TaxID=696485 RepID=UPI003AAE6DD7
HAVDVIKAKDIVFLLKGSELHNFLMNESDLEKLEENVFRFVFDILFGIISSCLFLDEITSDSIEEVINRKFSRNESVNREADEFAKYIDLSRLKGALLNAKFVNLDITTWRRSAIY